MRYTFIPQTGESPEPVPARRRFEFNPFRIMWNHKIITFFVIMFLVIAFGGVTAVGYMIAIALVSFVGLSIIGLVVKAFRFRHAAPVVRVQRDESTSPYDRF